MIKEVLELGLIYSIIICFITIIIMCINEIHNSNKFYKECEKLLKGDSNE